MSKYTTEVRTICESYNMLSERAGGNRVEDIITNAIPKVFDFEYPIFDVEYKGVLERKILRHYYTREIGFETVALWKLKLCDKLNMIMPYYNKLYESNLLEFDPFNDVNWTRKGLRHKDEVGNEKVASSGNNQSNQTTSTSSTSHGATENTVDRKTVDKFSDTPQNGLDGVEDGTYLTNAKIVDDNTSSRGSENITSNVSGNANANTSSNRNDVKDNTLKNTEDYIETLIGKQGGTDYSTLLNKYRSTFINIDMMVINELSDLFMGLW